MRQGFLLFLAVILLASATNVSYAISLIPQAAPESEEYAVYTALLKEKFIGKEAKQLVINKDTSIGDMFDSDVSEMREQLSPLTKETIKDFKSNNDKSYQLSDNFNLKVEIIFLSKDEHNELFNHRDEKHDGWKIFHQKYPNAGSIITLSRVGFNKERTQALVFVAHGCGWLCGEGNYMLLTKKDGEWKIEKASMTWIS